MCCFSKDVNFVGDTKLFCRMAGNGNQVVVYSMTLDSSDDVAMILPIPVRENTTEDKLHFLNFEKYDDFFDDVDKGFPKIQSRSKTFSAGPILETDSILKVHSVGSFSASFVPKVADFSRLDSRFTLPATVWDKLPEFKRHSFVVFKLKAGKSKIHPMAFAYPAANPKKLVFPTVHIHDGKVHKRAEFDHTLYCQTQSSKVKIDWQESTRLAGQFVKAKKCHEAILKSEHLYKKNFIGELKNQDITVDA